MKLLYVTAGTGSFYCGSCLRDQALVYSLRAMGHEVHLLPLYLPLALEQEDASDCPLFMGGVNVWLQDKVSLFRHTPRFIDKIFDSAKLLRFAGKKAAMTDAKDLGHMTVSSLQGIDGKQHKEIKRMLQWLKENVEADVICYSNLLLTGLVSAMATIYPQAKQLSCMQGEETFLDALSDPYREQAWDLLRKNIAQLSRCIGVSHFHTRLMEKRLGLKPDAYRCVYNGIDLTGFAPAERTPPKPCIGYLSRMCPAKGLHHVIDAFIILSKNNPELDAQLLVVGSCTSADNSYVEEQQEKLRAAGILERARFAKDVSREQKIQEIQKMTVMSVPCTYGEAFGLYILESLACAVPLVLPDRGAFAELLGECAGGIIYQVTDAHDEANILAACWKEALADPQKLQEMGATGYEHVHDRFDSMSMAAGFYECIQSVIESESRNDLYAL